MHLFEMEEVEAELFRQFPDASDLNRVPCTCGRCEGKDGLVVAVAASRSAGPAVLFGLTMSAVPRVEIDVLRTDEEVGELAGKILAQPGADGSVLAAVSALLTAWQKAQSQRAPRSDVTVLDECLDTRRGKEVVALVRRRSALPGGVITGCEVTWCRVDENGNVSNEDGPLARDELLVVADSEQALLSRVRMDAEALLSDAELHVTRIEDILRIERLAAFLREWM